MEREGGRKGVEKEGGRTFKIDRNKTEEKRGE